MTRFRFKILTFILIGIAATAVTERAFANDAPSETLRTFESTECWFESPIPFLPSPEFECGYVSVPERHENPNGPSIRLPVAILRSTSSDTHPDPLFLAQGGPGGDAFEVFPILIDSQPSTFGRDIVIFNQRGAPYAQPALMCDESFEAVDEILVLPVEQADARSLEILEDCYDRLKAEGIDLSAYNSLQNAADVDVIRQALGYDQYNFYGVSYGTLLGLHLMRSEPDHLRSVILDGVVPPDLNFIPHVASNTDRVFTEIIQSCDDDALCRTEYPNLEERFFALVDELNQTPELIVIKDSETGERVKARLDGDTLVDVLFQAFYLPDSYSIFPKLVDNLEEGDYTFIRAIWPLFAFNRNVSEGMYFSVICAEDANFLPTDAILDGIRPYFADGAQEEMQSYIDACDIWQVDELPQKANDAVYSDIPTLLLSGHYDPITPPLFAASALSKLSNGYSFVSPTGSHGVAFDGECMNDIVSQFLESPENEPDASCLENIVPEDFVPSSAISFPFLEEVNQFSESMWIQLGLASLFLLGVLSSFIILPVVWLIGVLRKKDHLDQISDGGARRLKWLGGGLALFFGLLAIIFVSGVSFFTIQSLFNGLASIFSVAAGATLFFLIPLLLIPTALALLVVTATAWRRRFWSRWLRLYYGFLAVCAVGYVVVLAMGGMITVLL